MSNELTSFELGQKIRSLRQNKGFSQERLAELVGVTFQQIQKYENGQTTLSVKRLQKIAQIFGCSPSDFFESSCIDKIHLSEQEEMLLLSFRRIKNNDVKTAVLEVVSNITRRRRHR